MTVIQTVAKCVACVGTMIAMCTRAVTAKILDHSTLRGQQTNEGHNDYKPWVKLIALGEKQFETRSWATNYRGELAIHAGKKIDKEACRQPVIVSALNKHGIVLLRICLLGQ
jgi:hypothetical protein